MLEMKNEYNDKNMEEIEIEYYIKNFLPLSEEDEETALCALSKISEHILAVMTAIFTCMAKSNKDNDTEAFKLQRCMIQYMAGKQLAIHNLVTSEHIVSINGHDNIVKDYTPAVSIVRSMYEMLLIHHSIFITAHNQEEQTYLLTIWKYKGLRFLADNKFITPSLSQTAKQERERFLKDIQCYPLYDERKFKRDILKNNIVYFNDVDDCRHLVCCSFNDGWRMLEDAKMCRGNFVKSLYSNLCAETHVTYYGLMKYEQQNTIKPSPRLTSLYLSCAFLSYMLAEIIIQDKDYEKVFNGLDIIQQQIIRTFVDIL